MSLLSLEVSFLVWFIFTIMFGCCPYFMNKTLDKFKAINEEAAT